MPNEMAYDSNSISRLLKGENDYIVDLFTTFDVPDSMKDIRGDGKSTTADEFERHLNILKNKMKNKRNASKQSIKRCEARKLKKNIDFNFTKKITPKPIFNAQGKIVRSKFDFAVNRFFVKDDVEKKPPIQIAMKMEGSDQLQGLGDQCNEEVNEWNKDFDGIDYVNVVADPKIMYNALNRNKGEKIKLDQGWEKGKQNMEDCIQREQKESNSNVNKMIGDNKKRIKKSKKDRIPGF